MCELPVRSVVQSSKSTAPRRKSSSPLERIGVSCFVYSGVEEVSIPDNMYARSVFIHWCVNESLETVAFDEARSNMTDLIQEYEMYETAGVEEVGEGEEDDEEAA